MDGSMPGVKTYKKRFGSFGNALEAAGLTRNKSEQKPFKTTIVYLVDFGDYYKVGNTQQSIAARFRKDPPHSIVFYLEFPTLALALKKEQQWLAAVHPYQYTPNNLISGHTECFRF